MDDYHSSVYCPSAMGANTMTILATLAVILATSAGSVVWCFLDFRKYGKLTAIGFCSGVVAGSVAITPAAGFVSPSSSVLIGTTAAIACNMASRLREKYQLNDVLEVFVLHGVGGTVGAILTVK